MNKFLALLLMMPLSLLAEEASETLSEPPAVKMPLDGMDVFQMLVPLLIVISLIFMLTWLVKKLNPNLLKAGGQTEGDIQMLSTVPVSNQSQLCLVRAGGKDMLIGVTNHTITHLQTFDEPVSFETKSSATSPSEHFQKLLNKKQ